MGKSPGKWIKTVLFGKKSSKSNLSRDVTLDKKIPPITTTNSQTRDFGADPVAISSSVGPTIDTNGGENTQLEKSASDNLTPEIIRSNLGLDTANDEELIKLEQAATKAQAAFRGYLARRAFWALKGIIRLQALVRGHLVRRQAVATLSCMRAIVEFQAIVRGQSVRNGSQMLRNKNLVHKERANLLQTSLRSEKLSTNVFAAKLIASANTTMPLSFQYDPIEPNSVRSWLQRWSSTYFWVPLPQPKKTLNTKPKRKQTKPQTEETETGPTRPKRSVRRVPPSNPDTNSETEKPKRSVRKASTVVESDQSHSELEKVKRNLRKISISTPGPSEKSEISVPIEKVSVPEPPPDEPFETEPKPVESTEPKPVESTEPKPVESTEVKPVESTEVKPIDSPRVETNPESNGKENQKTRRRKSLPAKQEMTESVSQNSPTLPSYMAATESAKAKLRAQAAAKAAAAAEEGGGGENGSARRQSLPTSTGKVSLQSPRVQKPLGSKSNKPQISPRDEKVLSSGWRR